VSGASSAPASDAPVSLVVSRTRLLAVVVACLATVALLPFVGRALADDAAGAQIFWQLRVPRTLVAALVGGTLGIVGAAFQTLFQYPLAAETTIGTMAGATLGGMLVIILGVSDDLAGVSMTTLGAFLGAGALSAAVTVVASSGRARMTDVLLAGIAVSLASGAVSAGLQSVADARQTWAAVQWSMGHLPQIGYDGVRMLLPFALLTALGLLAHGRALESMIGGEQRAHSQGVDLTRLRAGVIGLGALGVAACVAWCGPIAFVGLLVPHLVRRALGPALRVLLPMSWVVGAAFLAACDGLSRIAVPGREVPVGVLTSAIGAVALVVLVARGAREES
jgi:ABC-type Fe3+-siderophore transport system permease subunit